MREEWENYLLNKVQLRDLQTRFKKKPKEPKGFGILDGVIPVAPAQKAEPSSTNKQEHDALVAAASEIRNRVKKDDSVGVDPQPEIISEGSGRGKQKGRNKKQSAANSGSHGNKDNKSKKKAELNESSLENGGQKEEGDAGAAGFF